MADLPTIEPLMIVAGDTLTWQKTLLAYSASDGWTLNYRLINGTTHLDFSSMPSGSDFLINVPAATSAAYAPGEYAWQSYVTNVAGQRFTIETGRIEVKPNWAAITDALDSRSKAKQILDSLEDAWVTAAATRAYVFEYRVAGRLMRFATRQEWIAEMDYWRRQVALEDRAAKIAAGMDSGRKVYVRF